MGQEKLGSKGRKEVEEKEGKNPRMDRWIDIKVLFYGRTRAVKNRGW